jgi:hypothetical protein
LALYTEAELEAKLTGRLSSISATEYDRAIFYSDNVIKSYVRHRYEDPDDSDSEVFKFIGLELGMWHVFDEHFNEQDTVDARKMWERKEHAIKMLEQMRDGLISSDAAQADVSRQDIHFGVAVDSDDEPLDKYSETVVRYW